MSVSVEGGSGQDVDLNLAPIIDCFTVLITYLLVTASFISLAAVEVGVSASGTGGPPPAPSADIPPMSMTLEAKADGSFSFKVRGGKLQKEQTFAARQRSLDGLAATLSEIIARWPELKELNIVAEPYVLHGALVKAINEVQKQSIKVYLAS